MAEAEKGDKKKTVLATSKERMSLTELVATVNKKYGVDGAPVFVLASHANVNLPRIPTGALRLDYATGGGFPIGRSILLYGDASTGKSLTAMLGVKGGQGLCRICGGPLLRSESKEWTEVWVPWCTEYEVNPFEPNRKRLEFLAAEKVNVPARPQHYDYRHRPDKETKGEERHASLPFKTVWQDAEGTFDVTWAEKVGVDCDHVYLIRTEYAEQGIDIGDAALRSGECDILVVDSIAHLTPMVEIEETTENQQMGVQARLVNKAIRKWVSAINAVGIGDTKKPRPSIVFINHVHMNIGVMYGNPETTPGGKNQRYASSIEIRLRKPEYEKGKVAEEETANNVTIKFTITKNKTAPAMREGEYTLWVRDSEDAKHVMHHAGEIDETMDVLKKANAVGFIKHEEVWWRKDEDTVKYFSREELEAALVGRGNALDSKETKKLITHDAMWWCTLFATSEHVYALKDDLIAFLGGPGVFPVVREAVLERMLQF
jgi:protein RecA